MWARAGKCKLKARAGKYKLGARAGKYKMGARAGKYKLGARTGKYKLGARAGKYKLGARAGGQAKGRGPGNTKTSLRGNTFVGYHIVKIFRFRIRMWQYFTPQCDCMKENLTVAWHVIFVCNTFLVT